jgi:hypothetical protein
MEELKLFVKIVIKLYYYYKTYMGIQKKKLVRSDSKLTKNELFNSKLRPKTQ